MGTRRKHLAAFGCAVAATASMTSTLAAAPAQAAATAIFSWQLAALHTDNTGAVAETNYDLTSESESPKSSVVLYACANGSPLTIRLYHWTFSNGDPAITTRTCVTTWSRPLSAAYTTTDVTLTVFPFSGRPRTATHTIRYRDRVIASLGDSAASGEGAPQNGSPALWTARYCGRSGWAAGAQAALQVQRSLPDTTVHFWHLACAGASITAADSSPWWTKSDNGPLYFGGLLDSFHGTYGDQKDPPPPLLPPQITRLRQLQQQTGLVADRLLLTVGANDTHWSTVTEDCVDPAHRLTPHQQQVCLAGYASRVDHSVGLLPAHFNALARALARDAEWHGRVVINEYFDPLDSLSPQVQVCGGEVFASQYLRNWAITHVENPLQEDVHNAAARYGWHLVDGIRQAFQGHGVCWIDVNRRWVNSFSDSLVAQRDLDGTWHADRTGQSQMAGIMLRTPGLADVGSPIGAPQPAPPDQPDRLPPNAGLFDGTALVSADGRFRVLLQADGNLVLYAPGTRPLWATGTADPTVWDVVMQRDGNLVAYDQVGRPVFATGTDGHPGAWAIVQNDGNFVVYDAANRPLWATNTVQVAVPRSSANHRTPPRRTSPPPDS
jgi:hypothetical protein